MCIYVSVCMWLCLYAFLCLCVRCYSNSGAHMLGNSSLWNMIYEIVLIFKENSFGSKEHATFGFMPFDMAFED